MVHPHTSGYSEYRKRKIHCETWNDSGAHSLEPRPGYGRHSNISIVLGCDVNSCSEAYRGRTNGLCPSQLDSRNIYYQEPIGFGSSERPHFCLDSSAFHSYSHFIPGVSIECDSHASERLISSIVDIDIHSPSRYPEEDCPAFSIAYISPLFHERSHVYKGH